LGAERVGNYALLLLCQSRSAIKIGYYHKYALFKITALKYIQCEPDSSIPQAPLPIDLMSSLLLPEEVLLLWAVKESSSPSYTFIFVTT
jgi:hypothetical protein